MKTHSRLTSILFVLAMTPIVSPNVSAQPFVHPGIDQTAADLAHMKQLVVKGEQPWKAAFDRLKAAVDTDFVYKPFTHVLRGPYGRPNIGGDDLSRSANMAYNYALAWYITNDRSYAKKAIDIINSWSLALHDFDYNDAKLLAAWTGHLLCNAAEILRYSNSGWQKKDIDSFTTLLMTVYYPLMRFYYPQANGNWDGAIIHSIMAIAIFTDNRKMFNNAIDHFLHAPLNGSIFKYIYPSGQCQETMRDQGHVQLGLGEFAGAAQVAYTQGVDLFSIGNNRIASGYEYTASFLLGEKPQSYGTISERAKTLRDDYEYVYRHYSARGVHVPFTQRAADSVRPKASRSVLSSVRVPLKTKQVPIAVRPSSIGYVAGAAGSTSIPPNAIVVNPGDSIQLALQTASGTGKWVWLKQGIHNFKSTLKIPSNVTISGEGTKTVLFLDPSSGMRETMINGNDDLHDVTIRDLVIECSNKIDPGTDPNSSRSYRGGYNRGGILFRSDGNRMKNITLINLTVQNATYNGVYITGASDVNITRCNFSENGVSVAPGIKLLHNLLLTYCSGVNIRDSRSVTSPYGSGIALDHCSNVEVSNCEIARNGWYGISVAESGSIVIKNNLIEANDRSGVIVEFQQYGSDNINITNNIVQYNNGFGVETYAAKNSKTANNKYAGNGNNSAQEKISTVKYLLME